VTKSVTDPAVENPSQIPRPQATHGNVGPPAPIVSTPDVDAIMNALRGVIDPELGDNIAELGMVKRIERSVDRVPHITIALTTAGCPLRAQLMRVGAGNPVVAGHAALRYSWMSPSHRVDRITAMSAWDGLGGGGSGAVGGCWSSERWGRFSL
jgi:hypothetical protein